MKFLNGLAGNLLIVVILLGVVVFFASKAIHIQKEQATNYYRYKDINALETKNTQNRANYELVNQGSKNEIHDFRKNLSLNGSSDHFNDDCDFFCA
ncbi:hypothetical protein Va24_03050 [Helicobacter pylori]